MAYKRETIEAVDKSRLRNAYINELTACGLSANEAHRYSEARMEEVCDYARANGLEDGIVRATQLGRQDAENLRRNEQLLRSDHTHSPGLGQ